MESQSSIWIITATETEEATGAKSSFDVGPSYGQQTSKRRAYPVEAQVLQKHMTEFLSVVEAAFEKAEQSQAKMQLDEVQLAIEINGKGQVSLLGSGGEVGGKGAITLKFKRQST